MIVSASFLPQGCLVFEQITIDVFVAYFHLIGYMNEKRESYDWYGIYGSTKSFVFALIIMTCLLVWWGKWILNSRDMCYAHYNHESLCSDVIVMK